MVNEALRKGANHILIYPYTDFEWAPLSGKEMWDKIVVELRRRGFKMREIEDENADMSDDGLRDTEWEMSW